MTDKWMKFYPSAIVNRETDGDREYARTFKGEADKLLYQLKNLMKFRNLGQLKMTRVFTDGTIITARSVFGRDNVIVDTSRSTEIVVVPTCSITLINTPDAAIPMQYSGEIHAGEVEGTDYIKMYYTVNISDCDDCESEVEWTLETVTTHSLDGYTWAEVIEQGEDEWGTYIIWKAYTEESEFSRSGLVTLNITGVIKNSTGDEVCTIEKEVSVDCCEKVAEDRVVAILASQANMTEWGEPCVDDWCEAPTELPVIALNDDTTFKARDTEDVPGYGSCIDYEWELISGTGTLTPSGDFSEEATYSPPEEGNCDSQIVILLKDRCESFYAITRDSCCENATALSIEYTSLVMGCSAQQTLTASGGCHPYTWEITSGTGSIAASSPTTAIYTSPSSNPYCANNPTIKLTDCCGNISTLELTINCAPALPAGYRTTWVLESTCMCDGNTVYHWTVDMIQIDCDGTEREVINDYSWWTLTDTPPKNGESFCVGFGASGTVCGSCTMAGNCGIYPGQFVYFHEATCSGTGCDTGGANVDTRSTYLKSLGCCPPQFM